MASTGRTTGRPAGRPAGRSAGRPGGRPIGRRGSRSFVARPAICPFCKGSMKIDYKDASMLARYISSQGKIVSRRRSRTCAKHQRSLSQAIKRARYLAMLPCAPSHIWKTGGVGLSRSAA